MPYSMGHPNYRYKPWTPERRKAASIAAKRRWAEKRAAEEAEYQRQQQGISGQLRRARYVKSDRMNAIVREYRKLEAEVKELDRALELETELSALLRKHGIAGNML